MRLADAKRDHFRKLAKEQGFRSRSTFKLIQLNQSYHIFQKGDKVVDMGCAPGGWVQAALKEIGASGRVVGVDLKEVEPIDGAILIKGDIQQEDTRLRVLTSLGDKADLVLSDLAPNVSGIWDIDHARQIELTRAALSLTRTILRKGGNAIFKVFDGEFLQELRRDIKRDFSEVVLSKPKASRQQSSELYLVCKDFLHN
jgi:23S rRNA (uridine2552-2'-O)-methyltransferase